MEVWYNRTISCERRICSFTVNQMNMKYNRILCILLAGAAIALTGCGGGDDKDNSTSANSRSDGNPSSMSQADPAESEYYEVVKTFYGESATYGDMTVTVTKIEDPQIAMDNGKMAVFFKVTIDNGTDAAVTTNYLNNFALTVDETYYEAADCFTIPAMKHLYDFYENEAFADEIPAGSSFTGYLAAAVDSDFEELQLHYIPKTTDRGSRVSVSLTRDNVTAPEK